jgi:hypothetical protein
MTTICRAFATESEAGVAVDRLLAAGASAAEVRVLMGERARDAREAPAEGFAGASADALGSYAGAAHGADEAMGAFAGEGHEPRRGAFADVDRETVTTHARGVARVTVASHRELRRMLVDAGLDEAAADADVEALHHGRVLVLVRNAMERDAIAVALDA